MWFSSQYPFPFIFCANALTGVKPLKRARVGKSWSLLLDVFMPMLSVHQSILSCRASTCTYWWKSVSTRISSWRRGHCCSCGSVPWLLAGTTCDSLPPGFSCAYFSLLFLLAATPLRPIFFQPYLFPVWMAILAGLSFSVVPWSLWYI